jgi:predicted MPP superfamily phosphohydrolase
VKRVAWLTDIHLNFLPAAQRKKFISSIAQANPDALIISGDIAEAHNIFECLYPMVSLKKPIYFVLGNHDFYGSSIAKVHQEVAAGCRNSPFLCWLPQAGVVRLTAQTALIGCDSFADGRYGDYEHSDLMLNDYFLIQEYQKLNKQARLNKMHALGDEAALYCRKILSEALPEYRQVILATHVPPFREASYYEGHIAGDDGLPHFTCKAVGDVLLEVMAQYPDRQLLVLCGHTHHAAQLYARDNLLVLVGQAEYYTPEIQEILDVE